MLVVWKHVPLVSDSNQYPSFYLQESGRKCKEKQEHFETALKVNNDSMRVRACMHVCVFIMCNLCVYKGVSFGGGGGGVYTC